MDFKGIHFLDLWILCALRPLIRKEKGAYYSEDELIRFFFFFFFFLKEENKKFSLIVRFFKRVYYIECFRRSINSRKGLQSEIAQVGNMYKT